MVYPSYGFHFNLSEIHISSVNIINTLSYHECGCLISDSNKDDTDQPVQEQGLFVSN